MATMRKAKSEIRPLTTATHGSAEVRKGRHDMYRRLTAIVEREGDGYVALCPEVDVASQGDTVSEARDNLAEALTLFFESASAGEIDKRLRGEVYVTHMEVAVGWTARSLGSGGLSDSRVSRFLGGKKARQPCGNAEVRCGGHGDRAGAGSR